MPKFIPGLKLSKLFYQKAVKPILDEEFPMLPYSAAVIGWGSEVLGFDTAISRDHHWGPRLLLFLSDRDYSRLKDPISKALSNKLPYEFMGYSTNFSKDEPNGVRHPARITRGPVDHRLALLTERQYAPYSKWLGSSFARLKIARQLFPILRKVLLAKTWKNRETWLSKAYSIMAERHNALKITRPLSIAVSSYHGRPYSVIRRSLRGCDQAGYQRSEGEEHRHRDWSHRSVY